MRSIWSDGEQAQVFQSLLVALVFQVTEETVIQTLRRSRCPLSWFMVGIALAE